MIARPDDDATTRLLFRGGAVTVHEGACPARGEWEGHGLVFPRAGVHAGAHAVGDPTLVLVANAGEPLDAGRAAAGGHACTTFVFCPELVARPFARRAVTAPPALLLAYHALRGALVGPAAPAMPAAPLDVEARAVALLQGVLAAAGAERARASGGRRRALAEAARAALVRAPGRAHHLADVARTLDVSPSHLAHVFRDEIGVPLHRYLLQLRLAVALERLGDGGRPAHLSALALDLGFATHSHFSAAFRRWYGASPAAVRRALAAAPVRQGRRLAV